MIAWRPMEEADLPVVAALGNAIHTAWPERDAIPAERLRLAPDTCFTLADREIHGYLVAHPWAGPPPALDTLVGALPDRPDHLYLHDLALRPTVRGRGLAAAILARFTLRLALTAVGGSAPFWQAQGFAEAPLAASKLASYGPGARYMIRPALQTRSGIG